MPDILQMPSISIITPTIGRDSLKVMLDGLLPQLTQGDEVLIVGDGPQPNAKLIVDALASPFIRYWESPPIKNYGNPQRNEAISEAKGDYLMFVDDDDTVETNAIDVIKNAAKDFPGVPLMFKMLHDGYRILWDVPQVAYGHVSGQMFVPPNIKGKLGAWSGRYGADFDFMISTLKLYPEGPASVKFLEDIITVQGCAGPDGAGGREM